MYNNKIITGLHACSENLKVASEASLCYVDIDKPKVQLPEEMVAFPHEEAFIAELCSALDKHGINVENSEIMRGRHVSSLLHGVESNYLFL